MKTVYKWYCRIETAIVAAGFFAIVALTFSNAVLRAFNQPIVAADDICTLLFAWVSFMGADVAMRANRLVGMDLVTMHLSAKLQKALQLIVYVVMIATISLLIVKGVELAQMNWARFFNTLPISYGWATLSLPVCGAQMLLTIVIKMVVLVRRFTDDEFSIRDHNPDADIAAEDPEKTEVAV